MDPASRESQLVVPEPLRTALRARLAGDVALPLLSDTAARVMVACQEENSDLQRLANLVSHDQALAIHVLRVANSAGYAPREPILSVQQAIGRPASPSCAIIPWPSPRRERVFSVRSRGAHPPAGCTRRPRPAMRGDRAAPAQEPDSAFLCGLLHDVGMPILLQLVCDLEREGADRVPPEVMEGVMAEFHCDLGAKVAERWKLGPWIGMAVRHHHDPARSHFLQDEVRVTTLADLLAEWALDHSRTEDDFPIDHPDAQALGLEERMLTQLLRKRQLVLLVAQAFS
jgi:HD-like signal output (HDOD) protein